MGIEVSKIPIIKPSTLFILIFRSSAGDAFAVGMNVLFKTAIRIAYTQYVWRVLRFEALSLGAINDAFSASSNIMSLLSYEIIIRAPVSTLMVLNIWYDKLMPSPRSQFTV